MSKEFLINDIFWTFQGEGSNWGRRALFVRMPYCNLKCTWCDTEFNSFKRYSHEALQEIIQQEKSPFAVITGGEPMMNKQTPEIVQLLKRNGFEVACETNGTFPIVAGIDFVTVSPKRDAGYKIHNDAYLLANEFKYVVDRDFDFEILKQHDVINNEHCSFRLSPEFNEMEYNLGRIEEFIKLNPAWRLNLQTHKWIGIK